VRLLLGLPGSVRCASPLLHGKRAGSKSKRLLHWPLLLGLSRWRLPSASWQLLMSLLGTLLAFLHCCSELLLWLHIGLLGCRRFAASSHAQRPLPLSATLACAGRVSSFAAMHFDAQLLVMRGAICTTARSDAGRTVQASWLSIFCRICSTLKGGCI
jgi:hypothetical protein